MKSMSNLLKAARSPIEGVISIFSIGLFLYALYLISPWYHANYNVATAALQRNAEYALGAFLILVTLPGIIAPFLKAKKRFKALEISSFGIFLGFLFLTALRIIFFGWIPVTWMPSVLISFASAYINLWLKVRRE